MRKKIFSVSEYIFVFLCSLADYFLLIPGSDNYFFSRDYENTLSSIWWNSLHYGNGRLLGNILGIGFSLNYKYTFVIIALSITLLIVLVNRLLFNDDYRTVLPLAILLAFSNAGMQNAIYLEISTLANYLIPIILVLAALCIIKSSKNNKGSVLKYIFVLIFTFSSCLFSENTTITIVILALMYAVHDYISEKKIRPVNIVFFISSCLGGITMFLIPTLTESSGNLDSYRGIASGIVPLIKQSIINFSIFSDVFSSFIIPISVISIAVITALFKNSAAKNSLKLFLTACLALLPVEMILYNYYNSFSPYSSYMYFIQAGFVLLYAAVLFVSIIILNKSKTKIIYLEFFILTVLSIAPVMIVNICGYRTFFDTYIILFIFAALLAKNMLPLIRRSVPQNLLGKSFTGTCIAVLAVIFLGTSANLFVQSVYNFDYYAIRTQTIADQINNREPTVEIPPVPCQSISGEDDHPSLTVSILYKYPFPEGYHCDIKVVTYGYQNKGTYYRIMDDSPFSAISYAFSHVEFKEPLIVDKLTNVNK